MLWANDSYALTWQDRRDGVWEIYFNRLTSDGQKLAPDYRVSYTDDWSVNPSLLWTGSEYAIAFQDWRHRATTFPENFEIYLAFLDADGFEIDDEIRITQNSSASEAPTMALGDNEMGIAFVDEESGNQQVYFLVVDLEGRFADVPQRLSLSSDDAYSPTIVFLDGSFIVAWQEEVADGSFDVLASVIPRDPAGDPEGPFPVVTGLAWTRAPSAILAGDTVLLTYSDDRSGEYEIYGALFDSRLARVTEDLQITSAAGDSVFGGMARGRESVGVLYEDLRDGNWEVYFTRLLCVDPVLVP
jgi:hypothetical protein